MKQWWLQLNSREKQLVSSLAGVFVIFLFFNLVWQPLNDNLANTEQKIIRQQELLTWVQENTVRYKAAAKSGGTARDNGSLSSVVNRSAKQFNITISRVQPQNNAIQIWVEDLPFKQLMAWLAELANNSNLHVTAIDIVKTDTQGVVQVRRLQLGQN